MSDGINQVFLFGNLGGDPELKTSDKGAVLKFSLATTQSWLDKEDKKQERTEWHNIVVFGRRGEGLARHLKKGQKLFVQGRIHSSTYEKDGQKKYWTEVVAEEVSFGGPPPNGAYSKPPPSQSAMATPF